ncbi:hypothetical protein [Thiorhodococcus fuscus]|uniref:Uncharacterized protein n=1 Tax=Thiorhodococcus fuscus TaxID=527200 RepID=A0ABW4YBA5_9GAMM
MSQSVTDAEPATTTKRPYLTSASWRTENLFDSLYEELTMKDIQELSDEDLSRLLGMLDHWEQVCRSEIGHRAAKDGREDA